MMFGMSQKVMYFFCTSLNLKQKHVSLSKRINILKIILNFIGVYKKLTNCELVGAWTHSIINHVYWCAASSNGDNDLILEKWISVLNHVTDIQHLYPKYLHGLLDDRQIKMLAGLRAKPKMPKNSTAFPIQKVDRVRGCQRKRKLNKLLVNSILDVLSESLLDLRLHI